jgi:Cu+-exporting ATPase
MKGGTKMKKITMKIDGMHCASCATNLTKSLSKIGAKDINVNVIFGKAFANVEDNITEEQLKQAVKAVGFELKSIEEE